MNQVEFDFPAAIMGLAEADGPCPGDGVTSPAGTPTHNLAHCTRCDDTGRIVPFASLRVECRGYRGEAGLTALGRKTLEDAGMWGSHAACCQGRGWVPVSDVRVACWEIAKVRAGFVKSPEEAQRLADNMAEDSLILDTQAWLKEQHVLDS